MEFLHSQHLWLVSLVSPSVLTWFIVRWLIVLDLKGAVARMRIFFFLVGENLAHEPLQRSRCTFSFRISRPHLPIILADFLLYNWQHVTVVHVAATWAYCNNAWLNAESGLVSMLKNGELHNILCYRVGHETWITLNRIQTASLSWAEKILPLLIFNSLQLVCEFSITLKRNAQGIPKCLLYYVLFLKFTLVKLFEVLDGIAQWYALLKNFRQLTINKPHL